MLGHYPRRERSEAEESLILADWCDVLRDLPRDAIARACRKRIASPEPFAPVPGEIRRAAVAELADRVKRSQADKPWAPQVIAAHELERRRSMQAELQQNFPMLKKIHRAEGD